ncbi:MAG: aminotransferase class III-fold pyridoxal phosphate-dependent enzyme, partial [Bacteroidia bacterium]|nr:aminotransferase class III-fold pyridoxal phosphate-dependent enzyme [Bacteroidia bacterium]
MEVLEEVKVSNIWFPFTQMQGCREPIKIVKGDGTYLIDENGKKYIDAISSWWVNLHGHSHPHIAKRTAEQAATLEHVIFSDFVHEPALELSERLLKYLPQNQSKLFYSDNGSTSVEVALKLAIQYWYNKDQEKKKIVALKGAYHGDTMGGMSAADRTEFNKP